MQCPVCNSELHLELASGRLVEPDRRTNAQRWADDVETAQLAEIERGLDDR
jgi:hypothetical protein